MTEISQESADPRELALPSAILATGNEGKRREFAEALTGLFSSLQRLPAGMVMPPETGMSFRENALIKAQFVCQQTGCVALADDSGLAVDALAGAPGIYSARFSGPEATDAENCAKLLRTLGDTDRREAIFICELALVYPDGRMVFARGECHGLIAVTPAGTGGFGYDPLFYYPPADRTFAELTLSEKAAISHRGQALAELRGKLVAAS
ncbi:MAG: RdgB/HAM1 family non-canonical purine NTP pyrophosphatase [Firmicutes bacterium]|nr:RdgB/HAM1 family non-canonical purine NTP pyrophosphatase [Bacillota bacterium]